MTWCCGAQIASPYSDGGTGATQTDTQTHKHTNTHRENRKQAQTLPRRPLKNVLAHYKTFTFSGADGTNTRPLYAHTAGPRCSITKPTASIEPRPDTQRAETPSRGQWCAVTAADSRDRKSGTGGEPATTAAALAGRGPPLPAVPHALRGGAAAAAAAGAGDRITTNTVPGKIIGCCCRGQRTFKREHDPDNTVLLAP